MPAYIASIVAACIATSFSAANGEGVAQIVPSPSGSSFLANPPVAYLVAAPIAGPPTPSELRAQRVRARAARQAQGSPPRSVPYNPPNDQSVIEGFAAPAPNSEGTQPEVNSRLGATPRSNRARQRNIGGDLKGLDLSGMTPTQLRDLKSFINLAQGSTTGSMSPFLAPIVPITAEDLARIQEHLLNDNAKSENAKSDNVKGNAEAEESATEVSAAVEPSHGPIGASAGTTLIDRPVFVDRQGGPLVIIQQHAHHQEEDTESHHVDNDEESEAASAISTDSQPLGDDHSISHLADMEPVEYVPFALIDRDGRVAILERNNRIASGPAVNAASNSQEPEQQAPAPQPAREGPKQLPAAIRKQLEEGRLPPPPFMFGSNGGWPSLNNTPGSSKSQEKPADETHKDYYLAPAAGYTRAASGQKLPAAGGKSTEGTPILIRMPTAGEGSDTREWSPTALLLGKGPATVRKAIELEPTTSNTSGTTEQSA